MYQDFCLDNGAMLNLFPTNLNMKKVKGFAIIIPLDSTIPCRKDFNVPPFQIFWRATIFMPLTAKSFMLLEVFWVRILYTMYGECLCHYIGPLSMLNKQIGIA